VSVTVTSQVTRLPFFQGINISPSGRFPSDLKKPDGSLVAGMLAVNRPRHTRSLTLWCRVDRPLSPLRERPRTPLALIFAPHGHWWSSQILAPSRGPTATCTALPSKRVVHSLRVAVCEVNRRFVGTSLPAAVPGPWCCSGCSMRQSLISHTGTL